MRLDKYLADSGAGSRKDVKGLIRSGRVRLNGITVLRPENAVLDGDAVTLDGETVKGPEAEYWLLYKPAGCITAVRDSRQKTVMDYVPDAGKDVSPAGRLDAATEGVLLLTNDGMLCHRLLSPKRHVLKTYYAELASDLPEDAGERLRAPIVLSDETFLPAEDFEKLGSRTARLTIREGKYHEVRRMFAHIGCEVLYLRRDSFGPLTLAGLSPGQSRKLTLQEISDLKNAAGLPPA